MNKLRGLLAKKEELKKEVRGFLDDNKVKEAEEKMEEVRALETQIKIEEELLEEERKQAGEKFAKRQNEEQEEKGNDNVSELRALTKALAGQKLTEEERALISTGENGEGYLIPEDIKTKINKLRRQYKSAKDLVSIHPTTTASGSIVVEDLSTMQDLVNMTEMEELDSSDAPEFRTIKYQVNDYGALLPVSNVLLQDETAGLMNYLTGWFTKKAVRTENKKIFAALQEKSAKKIADWKELKSIINTELDPLIAANSIIVTNQDGFNVLDSAVDVNDRPILQPNPTTPTQKLFAGKPVHVFSNAELPTTGTSAKKAPIFVGNLGEAIRFIDRNVYEIKSSTEYLFSKNATVIRMIERFDVMAVDTDAYINGQFDLSTGAEA